MSRSVERYFACVGRDRCGMVVTMKWFDGFFVRDEGSPWGGVSYEKKL